MATRAHDVRTAEKLRLCEQVLDQICTLAAAGLDKYWPHELQATLQTIHRKALLGLDGKRIYHLAAAEVEETADPKKEQPNG